jgi:cytochrome c oxidase assembly factor CtaG
MYGARRIAPVAPGLARRLRLVCFVVALAAWAAALSWPLAPLSQANVLARMGQTVFICMVAAPLFWLAAPWHVLNWALPVAARRRMTSLIVRPNKLSPLLRFVTSALFVWFAYLSAVLIWHDPAFVNWEMASPWRQRIALLVLGGAALLFWQQITAMGPRRYTRTTPLARVGMLLGVEIPNVIAGITIAFGATPLYIYYAALAGTDIAQQQTALSQQALSGALTWIFGTLVYVTSIVLVVNEVFEAEGFKHDPLSNWDSEHRLIAPGLEERLNEYDRPRHDWDA